MGWWKVATAAGIVAVAAAIIESVEEPWQTGLTAGASIVMLYAIWEYRNGGNDGR